MTEPKPLPKRFLVKAESLDDVVIDGQTQLMPTVNPCVWKSLYEAQYDTETNEYGLDDSGTEQYRRMGCDNCDAYNVICYSFHAKKV